MAEDLQHLIDKIHREGIAKAGRSAAVRGDQFGCVQRLQTIKRFFRLLHLGPARPDRHHRLCHPGYAGAVVLAQDRQLGANAVVLRLRFGPAIQRGFEIIEVEARELIIAQRRTYPLQDVLN